MATVKIYNAPTGFTSKISNEENGNLKFNNYDLHIKINEKKNITTKSIKNISSEAHLKNVRGNVRINEILPFRIKFINVQIPGYGSGDVPPIGIAIIGVNNYIL